jgi:hypothetical protein
MIFLITTVVTLGQIFKSAIDAKKDDPLFNKMTEEHDVAIRELEERIKNIETILTSKDFDLEREFQNLK